MKLKIFTTFLKGIRTTYLTAICLMLLTMLCAPSAMHSQGIIVPTENKKASQSMISHQTHSAGLLLPRLTAEQRDSIVSPEEGLVIFNTTAKKPQFYNGSAWKFFDMNHHYIGEEFGGGLFAHAGMGWWRIGVVE